MTKGLALSGGGARGSFQMGALECLYTVFGYRPDVIAGTSVGSINGLALAQAENDDEKLQQLRKLLSVWHSLTGPQDFYTNRQWFADLTRSASLELSLNLNVRFEDALVEVIFNNLIDNAMRSTSLAVLDPLRDKMRTPEMLDTAKLARGVPLRMVCVSLESGRIRYATGRGLFLEDDNFTPVASALPRVAAIVSQHDAFTQALASVRTLTAAIENQKSNGAHDTKWRTIGRLNLDLDRARWRAEAAYENLAAANAALPNPIQAVIDPVLGALASAAIPGIFGPYPIGEEHYVDGGVREIVPVRAAVQMGATEVVAIVCSTQNLPKAGDAGAQNFLINMLGSLTNITLKEIVAQDLAGRGIGGVPVTVIIPSFDVHDTAAIDMGMIDISMAYGYMRAADVMSPLDPRARADAMLLSDAITYLRAETHSLSYLWNRPLEAGSHQTLLELRLRKWLIRKLVEARIASGVALPPYAVLWFQGWEVGSSAIPNIPNPWGEFVTAAETTPAVGPTPYNYIPTGWVYEERGDIAGLYAIIAGAAFRGTAATIAAAVGGATPTLTVPEGTTAHLPSVPVSGTVVAEQAPAGSAVTTAGTWYVDGVRRYLLNPAASAALNVPPTTFVPVGGLSQIPDGGSPYWVGGLVIADSTPAVIHHWDPTPQAEGSHTSTAVLLWNRSGRPVTVTSLRITTSSDTTAAAIFAVRTPLPITVTVGQVLAVNVAFNAIVPGPMTGIVAVDCDDPTAPALRLPLATSVTALGAHATLALSPAALDLGNALVGATVGQNVTIANTGSRPAALDSIAIVGEAPGGQFAVSEYGIRRSLQPGETTTVYVSYTPTTRGAAQASLAVELTSDTDVSTVSYHQRYEVPISGTSRMPTIYLAGGPRLRTPVRPVDPGRFLPDLRRPPRPTPVETELTTLDFGACPLGAQVTKSFWVRNVGDAPLTVAGVVVYNQASFGVVNTTIFPATLQPGGELEVPCVFGGGSQAGRAFSGQFQVGSDDPLRPSAVLAVTGHAAGPHLTEPSEMLDLGRVTAPASATLTFTSDGTDPVTVKEVRLVTGRDFTVSSTPAAPAQLNPGSALVVTVTLTSGAPGRYQDQLVVIHDGKPSRESSVILRAAVG